MFIISAPCGKIFAVGAWPEYFKIHGAGTLIIWGSEFVVYETSSKVANIHPNNTKYRVKNGRPTRQNTENNSGIDRTMNDSSTGSWMATAGSYVNQQHAEGTIQPPLLLSLGKTSPRKNEGRTSSPTMSHLLPRILIKLPIYMTPHVSKRSHHIKTRHIILRRAAISYVTL